MRKLLVVLLVVSAVRFASVAEDAPKASALSPEEQMQYARMVKTEWELSTQIKTLIDLADEHAKRSEEANRTGTPEKVRWENDRAQELRDKSAAILPQLNEITKQRLAFEASHAGVSPNGAAIGTLAESKPLNPEEFTYVSKVDERLLKVRQQMAQIIEVGKNLYSELQTNNTPEAVGRISVLMEENRKEVRDWEKEQAELELRKLEFRALRK
ncbi:MAG TPA: hypothetical protein VEC99_02725 [Clostridia bacterium]|nr:hypothetical protein [Clostridia bacterium]